MILSLSLWEPLPRRTPTSTRVPEEWHEEELAPLFLASGSEQIFPGLLGSDDSLSHG